VFVEDAAIVLDEVAVIPIMGAASRRDETKTLAAALSQYRPLKYLREPATLDGGDVLRIGRQLFVGVTRRTNRQAIDQLADILRPCGYQVEPVEVKKILHLKSACSALGDDVVLVNRHFLGDGALAGFELIDVPENEPGAANVLAVNNTVIIPISFPETADLLSTKGCDIRSLDVSELQKAEAGVTCCSVIFRG
jgi:dimethylargininase